MLFEGGMHCPEHQLFNTIWISPSLTELLSVNCWVSSCSWTRSLEQVPSESHGLRCQDTWSNSTEHYSKYTQHVEVLWGAEDQEAVWIWVHFSHFHVLVCASFTISFSGPLTEPDVRSWHFTPEFTGCQQCC